MNHSSTYREATTYHFRCTKCDELRPWGNCLNLNDRPDTIVAQLKCNYCRNVTTHHWAPFGFNEVSRYI